MDVPDWKTSRAGSKVRVALWLVATVGTGGTFTKADLRAAFPAVEQVDRRMRDLRADGWVIATYRDDRSLAVDELRLVTVGALVWEPGYRPRSPAVPARERRAVFSRDGYACRYCGISAGETYPDDPLRTARLSAARASAGGEGDQLMTLCDRCMADAPDAHSVPDLVSKIRALDPEDQQRLLSWIQSGQRQWTKAEVLWARFRRLPADVREEVQTSLDSHPD
jgi:hypothetical protein